MPLVPIDGNEIPDAEIKALEDNKPVEQKTEIVSEDAKTPEEDKVTKVPYHEDPGVQLYIERQIQKRLGEGQKAWEDRINRLEDRLTQKGEKPLNIGGWTPSNDTEAKAAKSIIIQAKKELMQELYQIDTQSRETIRKEDEQFSNWMDELMTVGVLKNEENKNELAQLIIKYKPESQEAAVQLWNDFNEMKSKVREEGHEEGEAEGIKKAQEAKIGSGRKGKEPGTAERSYQQRRTEEPTFDSIYDREMKRLGY